MTLFELYVKVGSFVSMTMQEAELVKAFARHPAGVLTASWVVIEAHS